jgi:YVTN family beta-propeller protein
MRKFALFGALAAITSFPASGGPPSYQIVARLPAGDGGWDLASVDRVGRRLYVAHGDGVTAIDLRTGKVVDKIVTGQRVHAALAIPGTPEVLSTNGETNNAYLFDGRTGRIRATIPTGTKPGAAAYDPATHTIWIMNPGSGDVTVVDRSTAKVVGTVTVGGSLELAVADGHGRLFVNVEDKNEVVVLDTAVRRVVKRFALKGCEGPTGITFDAHSQTLVSACANGVAIVSSASGRRVAQLPIGKGADGAAIDMSRHLVLIPNGRDGTLTIIRLQPKPAVVGQIATAVSARTIALDPSTGRAYLPSATLAPAQGNERPKPVSGTFRVLVLAPAS